MSGDRCTITGFRDWGARFLEPRDEGLGGYARACCPEARCTGYPFGTHKLSEEGGGACRVAEVLGQRNVQAASWRVNILHHCRG